VALWTNLGLKTPLLLLLGSPRPITVRGTGRTTPEAAVGAHLAAVLARSDRYELDSDVLLSRVSDVVAWITWEEINAIVASAPRPYPPSYLHRVAGLDRGVRARSAGSGSALIVRMVVSTLRPQSEQRPTSSDSVKDRKPQSMHVVLTRPCVQTAQHG
jgi:hypothetical protein